MRALVLPLLFPLWVVIVTVLGCYSISRVHSQTMALPHNQFHLFLSKFPRSYATVSHSTDGIYDDQVPLFRSLNASLSLINDSNSDNNNSIKFLLKIIHHDEYKYRLMLFADNLASINKHNSLYEGEANGGVKAGRVMWRAGVNHFSDRSPEERLQLLMVLSQPSIVSQSNFSSYDTFNSTRRSTESLPDSFDWRTIGGISKVKSQGACGACWSFATIEAIEGRLFVTRGESWDLSEQQLLDCTSPPNNGCSGGNPEPTMDYIASHSMQLITEGLYPYQATKGVCRWPNIPGIVTLESWSRVPSQNEDKMRDVLFKNGPLAVTFCAIDSFLNYESGVYSMDNLSPSQRCSSNVNHALLVVGFGYDAHVAKSYWIIKNSWSESWGMNGYAHVERGVNLCGIASSPVYPLNVTVSVPTVTTVWSVTSLAATMYIGVISASLLAVFSAVMMGGVVWKALTSLGNQRIIVDADSSSSSPPPPMKRPLLASPDMNAPLLATTATATTL